jgi:hypothetical protein
MYRTNNNLEVKLRLREMIRRSAELSATSSKLADMASQLDLLRKVNGKIGLFIDRSSSPGRAETRTILRTSCSGIHDAGFRRRLPLS